MREVGWGAGLGWGLRAEKGPQKILSQTPVVLLFPYSRDSTDGGESSTTEQPHRVHHHRGPKQRDDLFVQF